MENISVFSRQGGGYQGKAPRKQLATTTTTTTTKAAVAHQWQCQGEDPDLIPPAAFGTPRRNSPSSCPPPPPVLMNRSRFLSRLSAYSLRTLNEGGTLLESLALPPAYRLPLWIAGNSVSFYEDISIIWNVVRTPAKKMNCGMVVGAGYPACVEYR